MRGGMLCALVFVSGLLLFGVAGAPGRTAYASATQFSGSGVLGTSSLAPRVVAMCTNPLTHFEDSFGIYVATDDQIHIVDITQLQAGDTGADLATGVFTPDTPAATCGPDSSSQSGSALYLAWVANDSTGHINVGKTGLAVCPLVVVPPPSCHPYRLLPLTTLAGQFTDEAPTLTSTGPGGTLYLGWVGTDAQHHLNIAQSSDGITWTNKQTPNDYTHDKAGMTLFYDQQTQVVYACWVAAGSVPYIYLAQYNGTATWTWRKTFTSDYSPFAPQIASFHNASSDSLRFIWKAGLNQAGSANIYTDYYDGTWHQSIKQADLTIDAPAIDSIPGEYDTDVLTAFTGSDNSVRYAYNTYTY